MRTEAERSLLGTDGVMSAKAVPFNYLHFRKDDGGTTEKSADNDKGIGKRLFFFEDSDPFNPRTLINEVTQPSGRMNVREKSCQMTPQSIPHREIYS